MTKEMIISSNGHETMVAILEDDLVAEIFIERERQRASSAPSAAVRMMTPPVKPRASRNSRTMSRSR